MSAAAENVVRIGIKVADLVQGVEHSQALLALIKVCAIIIVDSGLESEDEFVSYLFEVLKQNIAEVKKTCLEI